VLTIDASVWVNADSPAEPDSASSRALLDQVHAARTPVIVPTLLHVEVAAAISRTRRDATLAHEFAEKLAALPFIRWIPFDAVLAERASSIAADHALRGADAHGCELISLDREHLTRLPTIVRVRTPAQALASL
jgi:predicted nucleic acid-binding protein